MQRGPSFLKACAFVLAATATCLGTAQAADSKLDSVLQRGHLVVGTGSTNAPWHFRGADGKLQGIDIDIARIVSKGLFNDASKVEFVVQSSDARIPEPADRRSRYELSVHHRHRQPGVTGGVHAAVLPRRRGAAAAHQQQIQRD